MAKALFFSDLHAHNWGQFATSLPSGRNSRLQVTLDVLKQIRDFCEEKRVTHVFMLGDVFHSRTKIDIDVMSSTWEAFRRIAQVVEHLVILRGNHDTYDKDGKQHSLETFQEFAHVVLEPCIWDLSGVKVACAPFTTKVEDWKRFGQLLSPGLDFFLFHQGVSDGLVGAFNIAVKAEVDVSDVPLSKATYCFAGHYHKHQWLADNLAFIGSPLQHSFNERTEEKGFLFLNNDAGEWSKPEFIPTNAPKFYLFESGKELVDAEEKGLSVENSYVRLKVPNHHADKWIRDYPTIQVEPIIAKDSSRREINENLVSDDRTLLNAYLDLKNLDGFDRNELLEIGMSLLNSASQDI